MHTMTPEEVAEWEQKLRDGTLFSSDMEVKCPVCEGSGEVQTLVTEDVLERGRAIVAAVAASHKLSMAEMIGKSRQVRLMKARRHAARRLRRETTLTLAAIGLILGNRDHATIINLLRPKPTDSATPGTE